MEDLRRWILLTAGRSRDSTGSEDHPFVPGCNQTAPAYLAAATAISFEGTLSPPVLIAVTM